MLVVYFSMAFLHSFFHLSTLDVFLMTFNSSEPSLLCFAPKDLEPGPELSVVGGMASCCLEGRPLFLLRFTPSSFESEGPGRIHLYDWLGEIFSEIFSEQQEEPIPELF